MLWEISNPSDAYTMEAPSLQIAACAVLLLGRGRMGATCEEADLCVPIFLFGGAEEWAKENGMPDLGDYINAHRPEVADALDSVLIGDKDERKGFEAAMEQVSNPEERAKARLAWQDKKRSSMNRIGEAAWQLAAGLRKIPFPVDVKEASP